MLFRDDDISYTTDWRLLQEAHEIIESRGKIHTVAVQMYRLWENKEVWYWLMTAKNLVVGLHGWEHSDYSKMPYECIVEDIHKCKAYWMHNTRNYKNPPMWDTFYPPWNHVSNDLTLACRDTSLKLDSRVGGDVFNFHYWELVDPTRRARLERACAS